MATPNSDPDMLTIRLGLRLLKERCPERFANTMPVAWPCCLTATPTQPASANATAWPSGSRRCTHARHGKRASIDRPPPFLALPTSRWPSPLRRLLTADRGAAVGRGTVLGTQEERRQVMAVTTNRETAIEDVYCDLDRRHPLLEGGGGSSGHGESSQ